MQPVRKIPYDGPKTHKDIIDRIYQEAQEQNRDITFKKIRSTVSLFFGPNGFPHSFRQLINFYIAGLGSWRLNVLGRRRKKHPYKPKHRRKRHEKGRKVYRLREPARKRLEELFGDN